MKPVRPAPYRTRSDLGRRPENLPWLARARTGSQAAGRECHRLLATRRWQSSWRPGGGGPAGKHCGREPAIVLTDDLARAEVGEPRLVGDAVTIGEPACRVQGNRVVQWARQAARDRIRSARNGRQRGPRDGGPYPADVGQGARAGQPRVARQTAGLMAPSGPAVQLRDSLIPRGESSSVLRPGTATI
jgi:hypothetical protein